MLDRDRFPLDEWKIIERAYQAADAGRTETMFSLGNGYLGLRGNHPDPAHSYELGTFINGFHETWPIRHAENAYGLAQVGQTIVNVPDAKPIEVTVESEHFSLDSSEFEDYERVLDLRAGTVRRSLTWVMRSGARLRLVLTRTVSCVDRHLAAQELRVTVLTGETAEPEKPLRVGIVSRLVNRQDEHDPLGGQSDDPRRTERVERRVLVPERAEFGDDTVGLAYRTALSQLGLVAAIRHQAVGPHRHTEPVEAHRFSGDDEMAELFDWQLSAGESVRLTKFAAYHDGVAGEIDDLVTRSTETLDRAVQVGFNGVLDEQRAWLDRFWDRSDIHIVDQPEVQQSVRWCLLQLMQSTARADGRGIAAKGVSGSGYSGHYFWDTEIYVLPFLTYTSPEAARHALEMRVAMLPAARRRAEQLSENGALFPWRSINGEEASAYYPAGTAQYHINADICFAVAHYVRTTGDTEFLAAGGIDIAVETARMWASLGFWRDNNFHLHGVTGPDEYTAVVDDNLYTNTMARFNLRYADSALTQLSEVDPVSHAKALARLGVAPDESAEWARCAEGMFIGYDAALGIHEQDADFLSHELWDFEGTPRDKYPLLLHFHPLVIYRHQVLKQADAVLAMFLLSDEFSAEQKLANFSYYDPLTTGDSTLSGVVQAIIAAEVGYTDLAAEYFARAYAVDLADLHSNAADGVHVASAGGVWSALVYGFAGLRDAGGTLRFDPRLPADWPELTFTISVRDRLLRVRVRQESLELSFEAGEVLACEVRGMSYQVDPGTTTVVPLDGQGPRRPGRPERVHV